MTQEDLKWVVFLNRITRKELARISIDGLEAKEITETAKLLAENNKVSINKIAWRGE